MVDFQAVLEEMLWRRVGREPSGGAFTSLVQLEYEGGVPCNPFLNAGDFAYEVGIPAKSGVGGGIVGVIPGLLAVCVWSPALNPKGNSLAGTAALERFTTKTGLSIF